MLRISQINTHLRHDSADEATSPQAEVRLNYKQKSCGMSSRQQVARWPAAKRSDWNIANEPWKDEEHDQGKMGLSKDHGKRRLDMDFSAQIPAYLSGGCPIARLVCLAFDWCSSGVCPVAEPMHAAGWRLLSTMRMLSVFGIWLTAAALTCVGPGAYGIGHGQRTPATAGSSASGSKPQHLDTCVSSS